jgi:hypothetical protein
VPIPPSISTPDKVDSRIGTLEFKDGVPSAATADKIFDTIDFSYAYRAFMDNLRGVSIYSLAKGMRDIGVNYNEVLVFTELMDAKSLFLTANADTIYVMGALDLSNGPVVVETPPKFLGAVQDAWFRWVIDVGLPGPDRGEGGKYLIVPPGYSGPLPDGYFIARLADQPHRVVRPVVPGEPCRSEAGGRDHQEIHQGLSLPARRVGHSDCRFPERQGQARADHPAAGDRAPRRQRQGNECPSAQ